MDFNLDIDLLRTPDGLLPAEGSLNDDDFIWRSGNIVVIIDKPTQEPTPKQYSFSVVV